MAAGTGDRQTLTANGATTEVKYIGPIMVSISGGFGATTLGTAVVQARDPGNNLVSIVSTSGTVAADFVVDFPVGAVNSLLVDLSGAVGAVTLVVWTQGRKVGQ